VELSFAEKTLLECFHTCGPGRPPRNPLGIFRAFNVMRITGFGNPRELTRLKNVDPRVRNLFLTLEGEGGYRRSVLSRFANKVDAERLWRVIEEKVEVLEKNRAEEVNVVLESSSLKGRSIRHPKESQRGLSDCEARVGRTGRPYSLSYKLHLSIEFERKLPLASLVASANQN
jgi:hypothetical protein